MQKKKTHPNQCSLQLYLCPGQPLQAPRCAQRRQRSPQWVSTLSAELMVPCANPPLPLPSEQVALKAACLRWCNRHLCERSLEWVFYPSNGLGSFFLYLSWPMEQDLCSERKPAPVGIQGGCLRRMGGILPCPGKQRAAARRRARLRGGALSPAVPALALLQDAVVDSQPAGIYCHSTPAPRDLPPHPGGTHCSCPESTHRVCCTVPLPSPAPRQLCSALPVI